MCFWSISGDDGDDGDDDGDGGDGDHGGRVMMVTVVWRFDKLGSSRKRHGFADKTYIRSNGFVGKARSGTEGFVGEAQSGSNGFEIRRLAKYLAVTTVLLVRYHLHSAPFVVYRLSLSCTIFMRPYGSCHVPLVFSCRSLSVS